MEKTYSDYMDEINGLICGRNDEVALANALEKLLSNKSLGFCKYDAYFSDYQ